MTSRHAALAFLFTSAALLVAALVYFFMPQAPASQVASVQAQQAGVSAVKVPTLFTADGRPNPAFVAGPVAKGYASLPPKYQAGFEALMARFEKGADGLYYSKCDSSRRDEAANAATVYMGQRATMIGYVVAAIEKVCRAGAEGCPPHLDREETKKLLEISGVSLRDQKNAARADALTKSQSLKMTVFDRSCADKRN